MRKSSTMVVGKNAGMTCRYFITTKAARIMRSTASQTGVREGDFFPRMSLAGQPITLPVEHRNWLDRNAGKITF
jgi:hypothetical protein